LLYFDLNEPSKSVSKVEWPSPITPNIDSHHTQTKMVDPPDAPASSPIKQETVAHSGMDPPEGNDDDDDNNNNDETTMDTATTMAASAMEATRETILGEEGGDATMNTTGLSGETETIGIKQDVIDVEEENENNEEDEDDDEEDDENDEAGNDDDNNKNDDNDPQEKEEEEEEEEGEDDDKEEEEDDGQEGGGGPPKMGGKIDKRAFCLLDGIFEVRKVMTTADCGFRCHHLGCGTSSWKRVCVCQQLLCMFGFTERWSSRTGDHSFDAIARCIGEVAYHRGRQFFLLGARQVFV